MAKKLSKREFLTSVLDEDPGELLKWHAERSWPEQQRFVQVLNGLYGAFKKDGPKAQGSKKARSAGGSRASSRGGDSPRSVASAPSLRSSASAPNLTKPIDVFEQKRQAEAKMRTTWGPGVKPNNTLEKWLDSRSNTPASVSTNWTECSQMTRTSCGTTYSAPCTKYMDDYRRHARAFAVNRRSWSVPNAHVPEASLVTDGLPEAKRMTTSYGRSYGVPAKGATLRKETCFGVFKPEASGLLEGYLETATPSEKEAFCQVGRAMHNFQHERHFSTHNSRMYDLRKNLILYQPSAAKNVTGDPYISNVPLGNLTVLPPGTKPPELPPIQAIPEVNMPPM